MIGHFPEEKYPEKDTIQNLKNIKILDKNEQEKEAKLCKPPKSGRF